MPEERQLFLEAAKRIENIKASIIRPSATLFGFPEETSLKRKIVYGDDFFSELLATKRVSRSRKKMLEFRRALERLALELETMRLKQAKHELPFELPKDFSARDVYVFPITDRWILYFLYKRSEAGRKVVFRYLEKK